MDNSWDYNDGESGRRMGAALKDGYRSKAFLMTKIDGRTAKAATAQLEESLRRLKTDYVDLLQHHEVILYEDADRIVAEYGAGVASEFRPLSTVAIKKILARTKEAAMEGRYELFKTSAHYGATAKNPDWLGEELPQVTQLAKSA